jgi:hypothetical protein
MPHSLQIGARLALTASLGLIAATGLYGQGRGGRGGPPERLQTGKAGALYDITGYWVSVVTEDWRFRMVTPVKGDYTGVVLNEQGRKLADAWDPAKDEAAGEQCRSYGAPTLMRLPGRLHISWQDDQTLKIEADAGEQTRVLHFVSAEDSGASWQGFSKALWEMVPVGRGEAYLVVSTTVEDPVYLAQPFLTASHFRKQPDAKGWNLTPCSAR